MLAGTAGWLAVVVVVVVAVAVAYYFENKYQNTWTGLLPCSASRIEVTFDIDANGIVNVSASDKGTGSDWAHHEGLVLCSCVED